MEKNKLKNLPAATNIINFIFLLTKSKLERFTSFFGMNKQSENIMIFISWYQKFYTHKKLLSTIEFLYQPFMAKGVKRLEWFLLRRLKNETLAIFITSDEVHVR